MGKAAPRRITDVAIDCAIHNLPDPQNGWRDLIPPRDLGQMVSAGSGQIGLQALVAQFHYDGIAAASTLANYYAMCKHRFMLSEPWSGIYGEAIINCWAAIVLIAQRKKIDNIAACYLELLDMWASTCALMESNRRVAHPGCRSWGFDPAGMGLTNLWLKATGRKEVPAPGTRAYGKPGVDDDWGWLGRNEWVSNLIFSRAADKWKGEDPMWLIANMPQWNARTEMCLYGWRDGSRLWTMGDDEVELDDEDANSNTPGVLAAGVLDGKLISLPPWPAYDRHGKKVEHLRQTAVFADIDGNQKSGWVLYHSALGGTYMNGYLVSTIPPYKPDELLFAIKIPSDSGTTRPWLDMMASYSSGHAYEVPPQAPQIAPSKPVKKRSFFDFLKKLWPF